MSDAEEERTEERNKDDQMITLVSRDKKEFQLPTSAAKNSYFIRHLLDVGEEGSEELLNIEVPRVNGKCMEKVVSFLIYYKEHPMPGIRQPLDGNSLNEVCPRVTNTGL
jgi:hypothetical protein